MRAVEVSVHNFRSIHDVTVDLEPLSIVAGANNAGKTNLIDAIRMFYGDLKWDGSEVPKVPGADDESWIEIEFRPTDEELAQLKETYRTERGTFRVRNYLRAAAGPGGKARNGYYAYEDGQLSDNLFYGAKNVGSGKVGHIVYVPAVSKVDEHTKLTGPSVLRELVAEIISKVIANSPAYQELTKAFGTFENEIKAQKSDDGQSLAELEAEVTEEIRGWDASFSLGIQSVRADEIVKSLVRPQLTDETHGGEIDQIRFGAGFQRHLIFTLIKLAARHSNSGGASSADRKEFSPQLTWILFEEPEAFLHPSQEEVLHDSLLELSTDGVTQVLLTTHSSRFVSRSMNDVTRLVRLRRDSGVTTCYQLSQSQLDDLMGESLERDWSVASGSRLARDQEQAAALAALKIELWLQPTRTSAFFARRVVLVEGPSECGIYSYLSTRGLMKNQARDVVIVDCMGKYNIHRFMSLMNAFGIDHAVLYDGDGGRSSDGAVTQAINDASGPFTGRVTRLGQDIECALGIPALERNERSSKPQHILYHLEAGLVSEEKLEEVLRELELLMSGQSS